jgi:hypothetical protein
MISGLYVCQLNDYQLQKEDSISFCLMLQFNSGPHFDLTKAQNYVLDHICQNVYLIFNQILTELMIQIKFIECEMMKLHATDMASCSFKKIIIEI